MLPYIIYYSINIVNDSLTKIFPTGFYMKKIKSEVGNRMVMSVSEGPEEVQFVQVYLSVVIFSPAPVS